MTLRPYWIYPEFSSVRMITDVDLPWDDANGWMIRPREFLTKHPGACLFSEMEKCTNGWVKAWLYNSKLFQNFHNPKDREFFAVWVDPTWLYELPIGNVSVYKSRLFEEAL